MVNITYVNPVWSTIPKLEIGEVLDLISYRCEYWTEGQYAKSKSVYYKQALYDKNSNPVKIFTGLIPRIVRGLKEKKIDVQFHNPLPKLEAEQLPYLKPRPEIDFVDFRPFQKSIIETAIANGRGCIESATGSGKTVIQLGLMSAYPSKKILLLCHTTGIIKQTAKEMKAWGFKSPQIIGAGEGTSNPTERIVLSTIQSFANLDSKKYKDYFDIVIVDECHRVSDFEGQYFEVLSNLYAPIRFGFTATLHKTDKGTMSYEALLGEKIVEMTTKETQDLGITAIPKIKIIKLPMNDSLKSLRNYRDLYSIGVVHNDFRNNKIVDIIEEVVNNGESALIFVTEIVHGYNIQKIFYDRYKEDLPFVNSDMPVPEREKIQDCLNKKILPYCIATSSWREGINIPELDNIILGGIGKSEIALLQVAGRGNRSTKDKKEFKLWVLFDESNTFLIQHFGHTISILCEKNWI